MRRIGQDGEMHDREFVAQMNRANSTMLLVSTLSAWNTGYLDKAARRFEDRVRKPQMSIYHMCRRRAGSM